jgi:hypothetical protein
MVWQGHRWMCGGTSARRQPSATKGGPSPADRSAAIRESHDDDQEDRRLRQDDLELPALRDAQPGSPEVLQRVRSTATCGRSVRAGSGGEVADGCGRDRQRQGRAGRPLSILQWAQLGEGQVLRRMRRRSGWREGTRRRESRRSVPLCACGARHLLAMWNQQPGVVAPVLELRRQPRRRGRAGCGCCAGEPRPTCEAPKSS